VKNLDKQKMTDKKLPESELKTADEKWLPGRHLKNEEEKKIRRSQTAGQQKFVKKNIDI